MKYLCLVYYSEAEMQKRGDDHWQSLNGECQACSQGLQEAGVMLDGSALQPVATATTVRVRDGQVSVTDGPFAETKEQLAGFYLIEARDLNDAIRVAGKIPPARYGSIEVRPVRDIYDASSDAVPYADALRS
ncbi:YciI family protein [Alcanivorax sediminis]|uniref:YciI family protein n=1 Tax=Alcanivorax sediminis TaxID=2663008 RepID=A0A6N7LWL1_9GAMM|nr:YciI family protein [Alcanivorax sediminis]MQX52510.1 YciI family protein [Alcanivorax sediminis]